MDGDRRATRPSSQRAGLSTSSPAEITVVHEVPAYRYGLALGLRDAGFAVRECASEDELADRRWDLCLLSIGPDPDCAPLAALTARTARPVVALLSDPTPAHYRLALDHGAVGVIAQTATMRELVWAVRAALDGMTLLPTGIARAISDGQGSAPPTVRLSSEVAGWLAELSRGSSIAKIARLAGYSERQMYRMLQDVYQNMGARNRAEAIGLAARWGLTPRS
jgi:DNA-binding NarL/FixJ family response regulator